jgi:hypothetical protein
VEPGIDQVDVSVNTASNFLNPKSIRFKINWSIGV